MYGTSGKLGRKRPKVSKTQAWASLRAKLKEEFEEKGLTSCELRYSGCKGRMYLSFAHLDKRRFLSPQELTEVVLCCVPCHQKVEYLPREEMRQILQKVIDRRLEPS